MKYLQCVVNQTTRMASSIINSFTKTAAEDLTLGNVPIKKGTLIESTWLNIFYNPQIFENPHEFTPERWQTEKGRNLLPLTTLIFGEGARSCIGRSMALINSKVMVIKFLRRYGNLEEVNKNNREYEFIVSYELKNTDCTMVKL